MAQGKRKKPKSDPKTTPNKFGRPTKYNPEFCLKLIAHMEKGHSFESFVVVTRTAVYTLYRWLEEHEDFSEAKALGESLSLAFWENLGMAGALGQLKTETSSETEKFILVDKNNPLGARIPVKSSKVTNKQAAQFSNPAWIFMMKNRFGWKDQKDVNLKGKIDTGPDTSKMTKEELRAYAAQLAADIAGTEDEDA